MKKTILAVVPLLLFSLTAFGQLEKGTFLLGGGVGFSSSTSTSELTNFTSESQNSSFTFSPDVGYFFKDNWVVGLSLPLQWFDTEINAVYASGQDDIQSESTSSSYGVAPFVRKYFPFSEKMAFYGQVQMGYFHRSTENITSLNNANNTLIESDSFNVVTTLGLSYFPKNWMGINLSISPLSYSNESAQEVKYQESSNQKYSGVNFGFDMSAITLGVNFFLSKK